MATIVGVGHVTLSLEASFSLKDKRRVVRSLIQRLRHQFNLAVAEVDDLDDVRSATLAVVCVTNSSAHADQMLAKAIEFIERNVELGVVSSIHTELIPCG